MWFMLKSPFPVLLYNELVEGEGMQYLYLTVVNQALHRGVHWIRMNPPPGSVPKSRN